MYWRIVMILPRVVGVNPGGVKNRIHHAEGTPEASLADYGESPA
jgi:hypothetical protein